MCIYEMNRLLPMSLSFSLFFVVEVLADQVNDYSHVWAVRLNHDDHKAIAEDVGLTSYGRVFHDVHEFRLSESRHSILKRQLGDSSTVIKHVHHRVVSHPAVDWVELQVPLKRERRTEKMGLFNDPSFGQQWHLVCMNFKLDSSE